MKANLIALAVAAALPAVAAAHYPHQEQSQRQNGETSMENYGHQQGFTQGHNQAAQGANVWETAGNQNDLSHCKGDASCLSNTAHGGTSSSSATGGQSNATGGWSNSSGTASAGMGDVNFRGGTYATTTNVSNNTSNNQRYLNIRPVQVAPTPIVTPSANISRYTSQECGPQQQIVHKTVTGLNNRALSVQEFEAGTDQYLIPAEQPYRKVDVIPGVYQLLGHKVIETSAVTTVSTGGGLGFGGNSNHGGGASIGYQSSGAIQRVVTTIRLQECVAYEVDSRPLNKIKG